MDLQPSKGEGAPTQQGDLKPSNFVEGSLVYLGIPAVTLYPLGFVALGIQLWRDPSFPYRDFTTTWEAVALIPQTVVVATGIRLIYTSLVATIFGAAIAWALFALVRGRRKTPDDVSEEGLGGPPRSRRLWSIVLLILLPVAVATLLIWGDVPIDNRDDNDAAYVSGFVLFAIGAGALRFREKPSWRGVVRAESGCRLCGGRYVSLVLRSDADPGPVARARDVPERGGIESCADEEIRGNTYVKLEEGDTHWHLYNEEGLFAIPNEELHYIEYEHCPRLLNRN